MRYPIQKGNFMKIFHVSSLDIIMLLSAVTLKHLSCECMLGLEAQFKKKQNQ